MVKAATLWFGLRLFMYVALFESIFARACFKIGLLAVV
jgi:hypothetical protein